MQALNILWKQSEDKNTQLVVSHMRKRLENGSSLAEAFNDFPKVFPTMYRALISVAEVGAGLVLILKKLSQYLEDQKKFIARVKRATMYPSIVMGFSVIVLIAMFAFVVPVFQKVLSKINAELPVLTQILFGLSEMMRSLTFWGVVIVLGVIGFVVFKHFKHHRQVAFLVDSIKLKVPIFRQVFYLLSISRFVRSFGLLQGSGVPLITSLDVARSTVVNVYIENAVIEIKRQVSEGGSLYQAFKSTRMFPLMLVEMIGIGETSGQLGKLLEKVADHLDEEVDYAINKFLTYLEPALIIVVGAIVLVVLLGVYLPIMSLWGALRSV